mmetsp:Transcript_165437/g.530833  ORF Transcript_165437/g.530833 Transcript_165437/m.530833 type:complete len:251 (+) Transcript_165437:498-1250(+)
MCTGHPPHHHLRRCLASLHHVRDLLRRCIWTHELHLLGLSAHEHVLEVNLGLLEVEQQLLVLLGHGLLHVLPDSVLGNTGPFLVLLLRSFLQQLQAPLRGGDVACGDVRQLLQGLRDLPLAVLCGGPQGILHQRIHPLDALAALLQRALHLAHNVEELPHEISTSDLLLCRRDINILQKLGPALDFLRRAGFQIPFKGRRRGRRQPAPAAREALELTPAVVDQPLAHDDTHCEAADCTSGDRLLQPELCS